MALGVVLAGRYELTARLGGGGFGTVWRAHDRTLGRDVAVKLIALDRPIPDGGDPGAAGGRAATVERFGREARAVASLNHPNVVTAHDFGVQDDSAYLVMELIAGGSLADDLAARRARGGGPLDVTRVARLGEQIAAGLAAAHAAGLVHRDLKPANIMLVRPAGTAKLVDFGIARIGDLSRLTMPGDYLGTLPYASPEQMRPGEIDGRSDLYSLGCVLYELLTGVSPYQADSPAQWISAHQFAPPVPIRERVPAVPPDLATLVHELLAKEPDRRPQTADAVLVRIERLGPTGMARPALAPTLIDSHPAASHPAVPHAAAPHAAAPHAAAPQPGESHPAASQRPGHREAARPNPWPDPRRPARIAPIAAAAPAPRPRAAAPIVTPVPLVAAVPPPARYGWRPAMAATPYGWQPVVMAPHPPAVVRPVPTTVAGRLLMVFAIGAGTQAVLAIAAVARVAQTATTAFAGVVSAAGGGIVGYLMVAAVVCVVGTVVVGVLAGAVLRGGASGRIWTWILTLPIIACDVTGMGTGDGMRAAATPHGADLRRPAVVHALAVVRRGIPAWFVSSMTLLSAIGLVLIVAAAVLLMTPAASGFVRARRAGAVPVRRGR